MNEISDKVRILIVDDQPQNILAFQAALESPKYDIVTASSGAEAIDLILRHDFAVVLLDVQMPTINGFEVARHIRAEDRTKETPIIFLTASFPTQELVEEGYEAGGVDYLFKPININVLRAKVSIFVELKSASSVRFKNLVEKTRVIAWEADARTGQFTYVSPQAEEILGYPTEDWYTPDFWPRHIHEEDRDWALQYCVESSKKLKDYQFEYRMVAADGRIVWLRDLVTVVTAANGAKLLTGYMIDITSPKMVERQSREELERVIEERTQKHAEAEAFLSLLIENIPNMVFVKDAKDLRFVRFNRAGEALLGMSRERLIGKNDYDFFPQAEADYFTLKDREVLNTGLLVDIPIEPIHTATGERRFLHTKKIPLYGADGKPEYLLGISEDVTDALEAEAERLRLFREQTEHAALEKAASRASFLAEASTLLASSLDYSETMKKLARLSVPELGDWCTITIRDEATRDLQRLAAVHLDPKKRPLMDELISLYPTDSDQTSGIQKVIESGISSLTDQVDDSVLVRAAKDERHLFLMRELGVKSCMVVPIRARERILGAISVVSGTSGRVYDAEDLKMAEELGRRAGIAIENAMLYSQVQRAVRLRDEFLSIASHELKTPVTSLKLQIQMARRKIEPEKGLAPSPEKLAKAFDISAKQVNRLSSLIDDLLDVSRIEAGKLSYSFEEVDLGKLVEEVVDRYRDELEIVGSPIELITQSRIMVRIDRFRIEQVVINLLTNAMKYGAGKAVFVSVRASGGKAFVDVKDHGIGIPESEQDRIFNRFERAISYSNISGLGLGLYISRQIVLGHQGALYVQSEIGKGSTFTVELNAVSWPS